MARPKRTQQQKDMKAEIDRDKWLMRELEKSLNRTDVISNVFSKLMNGVTGLDRIESIAKVALEASEQHRKIAMTIHNIRHPKSTVFVKNQVNQLAIETEQLKRQLESSKNATVDTRSQRETEAVDIEAQTLA